MGHSSTKKNWFLIFAIGCMLSFASGESANADGCWGSSRGGWGSGGSLGGGSFGCRGGLFQNAPVRNLLSRIGNRVGNGLANLGDGVCNLLEQRPLRSALSGSQGSWGSRGGSLGSNGSGFASVGSSRGWGSNGSGGWGSNGGLVAAPEYSQPAYISTAPAYESAPVFDAVGSIADSGYIGDAGGYIGGTNLLDMPIVSVESYGSVGSVSAYVDPVTSGIPVSQYETSAPTLDYGYYGTQFGAVGIPTDATIIDGSMITGPMMEAPISEGGSEVFLSPGGEDLPGIDYSEPTPEDGFGASEDDDSAYIPRGKAILSLDVPKDAKVYINDKLTRTDGTRRSYVSRNLIRGQEYRYRVKVVSEVDGREIVKSRIVTMRGGESNQLAFNFGPVITRVVVSVPDDAKVIIDGKETSTTGVYRSFSTKKLKSGVWDDYSVEVSVVRDGKTLTRKEKFDLAAGAFRFFKFDFDEGTSGSIASK